MEQLAAGLRTTIPDGLDLVDQLRAIRARVDDARRRARPTVFAKEIAPALDDARHPLRRLGRPVRRRPRLPRRDVRRAHLPGAHAARGRPRAPVPVHLEPVAEPRGHRARPGERRRALRAGEGAAAAPPLPRAPRRRALRAARAGHRGQARRAVPRHGGARALTRSASPATPTSSSRTKPRTSSRRSSRCCAGAAGSAASCASRSTPR